MERPDNFRRKVVRSNVGPALVGLLAPELMLYLALSELTGAYTTKKKLQKLSIDATLTHGFFLQMGGICLRAPPGRCHQLRMEDIEKVITASNTAAESKNTIGASDTLVGVNDSLWHSEGWIREFKLINEQDIEGLTEKVFACFQGLWVLTQVISRIYQHEALSLLEVTASAYICCAFGSYAFWWKKPQNCRAPIMITCEDVAIDELTSSAYEGQIDHWGEFLWVGRSSGSTAQIDASYYSTSAYCCIYGLSVLSLMVFGSIHLASWNNRLPSTIELWMWRGSSLYCVIFAGLFAFTTFGNPSDETRASYNILKQILTYGIPVYITIRIYMIVEVFFSMRALLASAY